MQHIVLALVSGHSKLSLIRPKTSTMASKGKSEQERYKLRISFDKVMADALDRKNEQRSSVYVDGLREQFGERALREETSERRAVDILPQGAAVQYQESIGAPPMSRMCTSRRSSVSFIATDFPDSPVDKSAPSSTKTPPGFTPGRSSVDFMRSPTNMDPPPDFSMNEGPRPPRHLRAPPGGDPMAGSRSRRASVSEFVYTDGVYLPKGGEEDSDGDDDGLGPLVAPRSTTVSSGLGSPCIRARRASSLDLPAGRLAHNAGRCSALRDAQPSPFSACPWSWVPVACEMRGI